MRTASINFSALRIRHRTFKWCHVFLGSPFLDQMLHTALCTQYVLRKYPRTWTLNKSSLTIEFLGKEWKQSSAPELACLTPGNDSAITSILIHRQLLEQEPHKL